MKKGASLATLKPLKIQALTDTSAAQLTTYKPSYDLDTAMNALTTSGLFEGPISLFALDPSPVETQTEKAITGIGSLTWKAVGDTMKSFDAVEAIAQSRAFSIAGGGDTLAAVDKYNIAERISYISTGGGAFLEFLEGKTLPAVAMLEQRAASQ